MIEIRKADDRGYYENSWLKSWHTFSFGEYRNVAQQGFSDLLVINEDKVSPSGGFATHPHNNMEIFTYILSGVLEHRDSMGNGSTIRPGDIQLMTAGTGVTHSEVNPSKTEEVHLLQIWIVPNQRDLTPGYQQFHFDEAEKRGKLKRVIDPEGTSGALKIHQEARVYAGHFDGSESAVLKLGLKRYAYVHVARGIISINGTVLSAGDGCRVREEEELKFSNGQGAEILVFDLNVKEKPTRV